MKLKSKRTLAKRIKITSTGKIMRKKITGGHLRVKLASGSKHRKNRQAHVTTAFTKNFKQMLPKV